MPSMLPRWLRKKSSSKAGAKYQNEQPAASPAFASKLPEQALQSVHRAQQHPEALSLRHVEEMHQLTDDERSELIATVSGGTSSSPLQTKALPEAVLDLAGCGIADANLSALRRFMFLNARWASLDVSMHFMSDASCVELLKSIPYFSPLTHLSIASTSPPTAEQISAALDAVQRAHSLKRVYVCEEELLDKCDPDALALLDQIEAILLERDGLRDGELRATALPASRLRDLPATSLSKCLARSVVLRAQQMLRPKPTAADAPQPAEQAEQQHGRPGFERAPLTSVTNVHAQLARDLASRIVAKAVSTAQRAPPPPPPEPPVPQRRAPPPPPPAPQEVGEAEESRRVPLLGLSGSPRLVRSAPSAVQALPPIPPNGWFTSDRSDSTRPSGQESSRTAAPAHPTGLLHAMRLEADSSLTPPDTERDKDWASAVRLTPAPPAPTAPAHPTGLLHAVKLQAESSLTPPETERDQEWASAVRLGPGGSVASVRSSVPSAPSERSSAPPTDRSQAPDGLVAERVAVYSSLYDSLGEVPEAAGLESARPSALESLVEDDARAMHGSLSRKSSGAWPDSPSKRSKAARAQWVSMPAMSPGSKLLAC